MKKWTAAIGMALLGGVLLCGCGQQREEAGAAELPELIIGCDDSYEPYTYIDESGKLAGADVELAMEACRRMGVQPVFTGIQWDEKDTYLANGEIDCIWSCYTMTGREEKYLWTNPYMNSRQVVAVPNDSGIQSLGDLEGKRIALQSSTKPEEILLQQETEEIPQVKEIYCMASIDQIFAALQKNYVDAVAGHETAVRQYMNQTAGQYRILEESLQEVEVSVAFYKEGSGQTVEQLNAALQEMKEDGTVSSILENYGIHWEEAGGGDPS